MIRVPRRWLLRIAIPVVAALGLFVWAMERSRNIVTLENRSGQSISLLQITRGGETSTFKDVPTGAEITAKTREGGPFSVEGKLADGTLIRSRFGEVEARAELVLLPGGQLMFRKAKD